MPRGKIKKLVQDKGFGFIQGEKEDIFFHHTTVADGGFDVLEIGQEVEFALDGQGKDGKGPRAASVRPI
jgi:cold shock protein